MPAANPDDPRERILDAVLALMAEHGYERLAVTDVAQRAGVSLAAFYDRFAGKDEAVGAAFRRSANRVVKVTAPAFRAAPDWPRGIAAAIDALLAYLVIERPFAGFRGIDVRLGSRLVVDVRRQLLAAAQPFAAEGFRQHGDVQPIAGEAIGASIDALLFDQSANWGTERLYDAAPIATYIALVPFVGVEQACAIATSSRSPASR